MSLVTKLAFSHHEDTLEHKQDRLCEGESMLSGIKQRDVVGKDGKFEIQTSELSEGTVVEVIILVEQSPINQSENLGQQQDATSYLLSNDADRRHLLTFLQQLETQGNLISFTSQERNEEHNIHS